MSTNASPAATEPASSAWSPFRQPAFAVVWVATVVSNIGSWMYSAASGWLMTSLTPDPLVVSLVQVASTLPIFLFAVPAGALADIVDRRKFLIFAETATTLISFVFAAIIWRGFATAGNLLLFTFLIGASSALTAPVWQSVVPLLVPKRDLQPAVAANSVGINVSRAVGPALAGAFVTKFGIASPFWINAISNLGVIFALVWWHPSNKGKPNLPAENFGSAIRVGFRYARNNSHMRATLVRGSAFFLFASAYWALLPLVARNQIAGGVDLYGFLLGAIGAGAVGGAFALPSLKKILGPDRLVAAGSLGTAAAMVMFGMAHEPIAALSASVIAGVSWIAVLSSLNVSAQVALPDWVRGRGLAIYVTMMFGSLALGSAIWGKAAGSLGLPLAHYVAAAAAVVAIPLTWKWKLQTGAGADLTPSMHWPAPVASYDVEHDRGPVLVTVEYRIVPKNRGPFLAALKMLGRERRRDGAYAWRVFEDAAVEGRMVETFLLDSWLEHLRQHERVTNADHVLQNLIKRFHVEGEPRVTHLIAAQAVKTD